jgi:cytochrome oxidase Cu insertion factor (SCO1/SenC/PrrC family)
MTTARAGVLVAVAVVLLIAGCGAPAGVGTEDRRPQPGSNPRVAPDFTVETFDGETFTLSEHRGTPVVINFWESW